MSIIEHFSTWIVKLLSLVCLLSVITQVESSRILAVFPHIGKSHQDVFQPLVDALAKRGHEITVVSFFPKKVPLPNYTDIQVHSEKLMFNSFPLDGFTDLRPFKDFRIITNVGLECCEIVLSSPSVQNLLASDLQFDLIITELFQIDCFLGFVHRFRAPFVALSSSILFPSASDRFGNPDNPAFIPNLFLSYSDKMTYFQRMHNTFTTLLMKFFRTYYYEVTSERIARKYFGADMPPLHEIARNTSLVMVNSHPSLNRPRPQVPAIIDVGGMHIKDPQPLPKDLKQYMDDASNGIIVFSMGSTLLTHTFPEEKRKIFMDVFGEMKQNVVYKWENSTVPNKPGNIKLLQWLPQRDMLAHPNIVAFVSHGGLLGTTEAVFCGVPILGIPIYGDQATNIRSVEASGAGIFLSYSELTKESFKKAITALVNENKYKENAKRLSALYRDRPIPPLETAIFWTEHIIRSGGGDHLRTAGASMPFYQYHLLDIIFGASVIVITVLYAIYQLSYRLTMCIVQRNHYSTKNKKTN